jgi:hypothetical protein
MAGIAAIEILLHHPVEVSLRLGSERFTHIHIFA